MQVDIGNDKICHNFSSIVASAEIRDLNERVQQEHLEKGGGTVILPAPQRRVDPNAGVVLTTGSVTPAHAEQSLRSARRGSLNLSRSSAGSRHHHHQHHTQAKQSSAPHNRTAASPFPDEAGLPPPPPPPSAQVRAAAAHCLDASAGSSTPPMAAVVSPPHRQGGNWSDAVRNSTAGSVHSPAAAATTPGDNGVTNNGAMSNPNNDNNGKNNAAASRRAEEAAAGSQDNNGSGNEDKPAQPAGPKLAQTKIQLGMRLRRWVIINRIGAGSFGETFTAMEVSGPVPEEDSLTVTPENLALLEHLPPPEERHEVCIKVEQENKNVLRLEALALKKVQPCPQVVRYLGSGCTNGMNYLVMEKLGPNLAELRRRSQHGTFNIYTTLKAGISCLTAIRGVHDLGLVHRDIKPSNFVTGLPNTPEHTTCYLIDFGLARRFRRSNGEIRPPRDNAGFRGTSRYASVASHHHQELGRVDDLWSLLFMLVEFATGTLPWRKYKDKDDIGRCKEESITPHLVRNLPREFQPFLAHLQTLRYEDEPDYDLLLTLMHRALERRGYPPNKPVEWEMDPSMMDDGADVDGHDGGAGRNEAEKAPTPNAAAAAAAAVSPQLPSPPQLHQQVSSSVNPAHDAAANSGHNFSVSRPAAVPQPNISDTAAAAKKAQPYRTSFSPGGLQTSSAGGANSRGMPAAGDLINGQVENNNNINGTPLHHSSGMLRISDVDVVGSGGGVNKTANVEASVVVPPGAPQLGTFEGPNGVTGFAAEGSETPGAHDSSEDFDPNEFSPREVPKPAKGDQDSYNRLGRSTSAPAPNSAAAPAAASAVASPSPAIPAAAPSTALPPSNSAVEPNNTSQWKEAGELRNGGQLAQPHGETNSDVMVRLGNAPIQQPMGGPTVDLDAPSNDNVEVQQGGQGKKHAKDKKKSNCDCKVM